jgi:hypothetical protein
MSALRTAETLVEMVSRFEGRRQEFIRSNWGEAFLSFLHQLEEIHTAFNRLYGFARVEV